MNRKAYGLNNDEDFIELTMDLTRGAEIVF